MVKKNKPLIFEIWQFVMENKAWWLIPLIIFLLLVAILIIFGQTTAVSPFVYVFF